MTTVVIQPETETLSPSSELELEAIENSAEAIEVVSDNEVTIAAIEADKEIQIAQIHAEARVEEAEAYAGKEDSKGDELWNTLNRLLSVSEAMEDRLRSLEQMQTSLILAEAETLETVEEAAETMEDLTLQSTSVPTSETQMEAIPKSAEENQETILPPLLEVAGNPIIRLV